MVSSFLFPCSPSCRETALPPVCVWGFFLLFFFSAFGGIFSHMLYIPHWASLDVSAPSCEYLLARPCLPEFDRLNTLNGNYNRLSLSGVHIYAHVEDEPRVGGVMTISLALLQKNYKQNNICANVTYLLIQRPLLLRGRNVHFGVKND